MAGSTSWVAGALCLALLAVGAGGAEAASRPWRGVHIAAPNAEGLTRFRQMVVDHLAPMGVNTLVLEVDYSFRYESHPELSLPGSMDKAQARELVRLCRRRGIRVIPQFQCLGHQSWSENTLPLLVKYPELDETPGIPMNNPDIYCRSWCPLHPKVNEIVFALMDELIDAFGARALHVGMDEVFLIGSDQCDRCRGKDPAELLAKAVNDYHDHLVGKRKLEMLMWGDRLLDDEAMGYGEWEASRNGTAPAITKIPTDIIMCDWHYEPRDDYPSVRYFQEKGFRVWPSSWRNVAATGALIACARQDATERMLGHLCTTWTSPEALADALEATPPVGDAQALDAVAALRAAMREMGAGKPSYWRQWAGGAGPE